MFTDPDGNPINTVWVLGAGFSRSLGGPLLPDLLRQMNRRDLAVRYPGEDFGDLADACRRAQTVFNFGRQVEGLWHDAEDYLEFLDSTQTDAAAASTILRLASQAIPMTQNGHPPDIGDFPASKSSVDGLRRDGIRAVAAECSWFVNASKSKLERWQPYRAWAAALHPKFDTIISTNYDTVAETASERRVWDVLPHDNAGPSTDYVRLFKLHGSVTWKRANNTCERVAAEACLQLPDGFLALGTPGNSKRELLDSLFGGLWQQAEECLRGAGVIVFLGYRFPESDSDARRRLLGAIASNRTRDLRIRIVLGPDTNAVPVLRLRRLLEVSAGMSRKRFIDTLMPHVTNSRVDSLELRTEPLLAEDFLALYADHGPLSSVVR